MVKLSHTPPRGAGRVKGISKVEQLLACLRKAGTDKNFNPVAIRSPDLAAACQIPVTHVSALLNPCVKDGRVVMCKVTPAGGRPVNEYRLGPGVPPPEHKPLSLRKSGAALGQPGKPLPVSGPAPKLSTPRPGVNEIEVASLGKPQRDGGPKPPAAGDQGPPPVEPAVAAAQATPEPKAGAALKKEPAAPRAPAGDALSITIDHAGVLTIATDEAVIELQQAQCRRLGQFLVGTQGVWSTA